MFEGSTKRSDKWLKRKEGCLEMEPVMMVWETQVPTEGDDKGGRGIK